MKRALILVPVIALVALGLLLLVANIALDSAPVRARIQDALQRATGRDARIGRVSVAWSLSPSLRVDDVAILNPPGFSRPDLLSIRRTEATLTLAALLQGPIAISDLSFTGPDLLLERDAAGQPNWQLPAFPRPASPQSAAAPSPAAGQPRTSIAVQAVHVVDARFEYRGTPPVSIPALQIVPTGGPVVGTLVVNGTTLAVTGQASPTAYDLAATTGTLRLAVSGQVGGQASDATVALNAADLTDAARLAGRDLPPLRDVALTARLGPGGLTAIQFGMGPADLASLLPGLRVKTAAAVTGAIGQPIHATAEATLGALPLTLVLDTGAPAGVMPIKALLTAEAATATLQGTLDVATRVPNLTLSARIPDVERLGTLAGAPLPPLTDATLDARVLSTSGGAGALLRGLRITSAQGDLDGDLALTAQPRLSVRGSLISQRLDLDALLKPSSGREPGPGFPSATSTAPSSQPIPVPSTPVPPTPAPPTAWLIPDTPLPLAVLGRADADLRLAIATLQTHGATYRNLETRLLLQGARLRVDPLTLQTPAGALQATMQIDASATPATAALVLRAPSLDAAGFAAALGQPAALTGAADLDIDLRAQGATPHALAATLSGRLAFAMSEGDIANEALASLFGPALRSAGIGFDPAGRSRIRCLGLRLDAAAGQASVPLIALDTTRLRLDGDGQLDLAREIMDLHLRPTLRLGPTSVAIPVRLSGPWRTPKPAADKGIIAPGRFGIAIGAAAPDPCARLAPSAPGAAP